MNKQLKFVIFLSLIIYNFFSITEIHSLNQFILTNNKKELDFIFCTEYYEDKDQKLTIDDFLTDKLNDLFIKHNRRIPNLGYSNSSFWLKFKLKNNIENNDNLILEMNHPFLSEINLFYFDKDGAIIKKLSGHALAFNKREIKNRNYIFSIPIEYQEEKTIYINLKSIFYISFFMSIYTQEKFLEKEILFNFIYGIYYGIMLIILILNILIYLIYLDKSFLYYIFFFLSIIIVQSILNNISTQFLWPDSSWLNINSLNISLGISTIFGILFTKSFFKTDKNFPKINIFFDIFILILLINIIFSLFIKESLSLKFNGILSITCVLTLLSISIISILKKNYYAIYYLFAWSLLLIGILMMSINTLDLFRNYFFISYFSFQFGSLFLVILLPISFLDKYRILKKEKDIADKTIAEKEKDKFASIGMLLGGISHEIYNPLSGITGPVDNLKKLYKHTDNPDISQIYKYLDYIDDNSQRINNIIKNITALYINPELKKDQINLKEIILQVVLYYKKNINKKINFILEVNNNIQINTDKNAIFQILNNLISNAVDSIKKNGKIKISFEKNTENKTIKISDDGQGINIKDINKIFNAFYTTKSIGGSHIGLGLYIVKDLIIKLGWDINVSSMPKKGTVFNIIIKD